MKAFICSVLILLSSLFFAVWSSVYTESAVNDLISLSRAEDIALLRERFYEERAVLLLFTRQSEITKAEEALQAALKYAELGDRAALELKLSEFRHAIGRLKRLHSLYPRFCNCFIHISVV